MHDPEHSLSTTLVRLGLVTESQIETAAGLQATEHPDLSITQILLKYRMITAEGLERARAAPRGSTAAPGSVLGLTLGGCRLERELGRGGMGVVYLAEEEALGRKVAVKVLPPEFAREGEALQRFQREARAAAKLSHPHIARIYQVGRQENVNFLVMELAEGGSVAERLRREGALPEAEAVRIVDELLQALDAAHRAGITHRDVKAENLLLTQDGRVLLSDFGIARDVSKATMATTLGTALGSPYYMAPELWDGKRATPQSDLFAAGVTFYYLLTGGVPFGGTSPTAVMKAIVTSEPDMTRVRRPDLRGVVDWLLAKDPAQRPASADDVRETLAGRSKPPAIGGSGPGRAVDAPKPGHGARAPVTRRRVAVLLLVLGFVLVGTVLAIYLRERSRKSGGTEPGAHVRDSDASIEAKPQSPSMRYHGEASVSSNPAGSVAPSPTPRSQPESAPVAAPPVSVDQRLMEAQTLARSAESLVTAVALLEKLDAEQPERREIRSALAGALLGRADQELRGGNALEAWRFARRAESLEPNAVARDLQSRAEKRLKAEVLPTATFDRPQEKELLKSPDVDVVGHVTDGRVAKVRAGGGTAVSVFGNLFTCRTAALPEGQQDVAVELLMDDGPALRRLIPIIVDLLPPFVAIKSPAPGALCKASVEVLVEVRDATAVTLWVNDTEVRGTVAESREGGASRPESRSSGMQCFSRTLILSEGVQLLTVKATDAVGRTSTIESKVQVDSSAPKVALTAPSNGLVTMSPTVEAAGSVDDATVRLEIAGTVVRVGADGSFSSKITLPPNAETTIPIRARDLAGNESSEFVRVSHDATPPAVIFNSPAQGAVCRGDATVDLRVQDTSSVRVWANGVEAQTMAGESEVRGADPGDPGPGAVPAAAASLPTRARPVKEVRYTSKFTLPEGEAVLSIKATDAAGGTTVVERRIVVDTTPPDLWIDEPAEGAVVPEGAVTLRGTVVDLHGPCGVTVDGMEASVGADGHWTAVISLRGGEHALEARATDGAGNTCAPRGRRIFKIRTLSWADPKSGSAIDRATGLPSNIIEKSAGIEMTLIPSGEFMMGKSPGDAEADEWEQPASRVTMSEPFYLGRYEVRYHEWKRAMGLSTVTITSPGRPNTDHLFPAHSVSWDDVQPFLTKTALRLPTAAEWEYACRAGSTEPRYGPLDAIAWHSRNSGGLVHRVGEKAANAFGLYDMTGNLWEWCADVTVIRDRDNAPGRVLCGGSWFEASKRCRSSAKAGMPSSHKDLSTGFRVARTP